MKLICKSDNNKQKLRALFKDGKLDKLFDSKGNFVKEEANEILEKKGFSDIEDDEENVKDDESDDESDYESDDETDDESDDESDAKNKSEPKAKAEAKKKPKTKAEAKKKPKAKAEAKKPKAKDDGKIAKKTKQRCPPGCKKVEEYKNDNVFQFEFWVRHDGTTVAQVRECSTNRSFWVKADSFKDIDIGDKKSWRKLCRKVWNDHNAPKASSAEKPKPLSKQEINKLMKEEIEKLMALMASCKK